METPRSIFAQSAITGLEQRGWKATSAPATPRAAVHERSRELVVAESQFFASDAQKETVQARRKAYPNRKTNLDANRPKLPSEQDPENIPRRIMGFGLGFEKIFATTSTKLPVSAYTIFVELHLAHNEKGFSRCFNGLHTIFDLKKWIYEKIWVPMDAYDLSYAEPGKATLTDQLRLLTTQDSLDTRTLATTRAVHRMYKGVPGVHCIDDLGVTRLYVRLRCRGCGDLLNSLQTCRKHKSFGDVRQPPDAMKALANMPSMQAIDAPPGSARSAKASGAEASQAGGDQGPMMAETKGIPGLDPSIEDLWYAPDKSKHCLFHTRGFEMFEAARAHGGHAELARIYISCGREPSKKLSLATNVLIDKQPRGAKAKISY